jgi:hypothetical protein
MKGWQATLALVGGLVAGMGLWFGFMWLGAPPARLPAHVVSAPQATPNAGSPAAMTENAPAGITQATAAGDEEPNHHAFTITQQADALGALLASAPTISHGHGGPALYLVVFRSCPACLNLREKEEAALEAAGVDLHWIVYARRDRGGEIRSSPEELAVVAELTHTRDPALFDAWNANAPDEYYRAAKLPPRADSSPERLAAIEGVRALVDQLNEIVAENGQAFAVPALFWREGNVWRGYIGYDEATFPEVVAGLGIIGPATTPAPAGAPQP